MNNLKSEITPIEKAFYSNDQTVIENIYKSNFKKVSTYVLKNSGTEQDAKDVYQDAFIVLWKKATLRKGSFKSASEASGFLYQVAKNKWLDELKSSRKKNRKSLELADPLLSVDTDLDEIRTQRLSKIKQAFEGLGGQCRKLLQKFYYEKKNMKEIGEELSLDPASARNQKYRCMNKLKNLTEKI